MGKLFNVDGFGQCFICRICHFSSIKSKIYGWIWFGYAHGILFLGMATCSALGAGSAVMLMAAHGLSIAAMFLLSNFVYRRVGTYEMDEMGGLGSKTPLLACFLLLHPLQPLDYLDSVIFWGNLVYFFLWEEVKIIISFFFCSLGYHNLSRFWTSCSSKDFLWCSY